MSIPLPSFSSAAPVSSPFVTFLQDLAALSNAVQAVLLLFCNVFLAVLELVLKLFQAVLMAVFLSFAFVMFQALLKPADLA